MAEGRSRIVLDGIHRVMERAADRTEVLVTRSCLVIEAKMIQKLSRGQAVRRTRSGRLVGLNPSKPGEPPKVLTGALRQRVTHVVEREPKRITGRVGSNVPYARRLELGFTGTDGAGRVVNQQARPYARPSLDESWTEIQNIFRRG